MRPKSSIYGNSSAEYDKQKQVLKHGTVSEMPVAVGKHTPLIRLYVLMTHKLLKVLS